MRSSCNNSVAPSASHQSQRSSLHVRRQTSNDKSTLKKIRPAPPQSTSYGKAHPEDDSSLAVAVTDKKNHFGNLVKISNKQSSIQTMSRSRSENSMHPEADTPLALPPPAQADRDTNSGRHEESLTTLATSNGATKELMQLDYYYQSLLVQERAQF